MLEAEDEPGGYCRTVVQDGFAWDYSGHFFHFRDPAIEAWLRARMPGQEVATVARRAAIRYAGRDIDVPFQTHIHPVGGYGGWTCCSIEDNLVETRALAQQL